MSVGKFVVAVLLVAPVVVAQSPDPGPIAFKQDRLAMSLADFQKAHHDPGIWTITTKGNVWQPALQCKPFNSALTNCFYNTSIANQPASSSDFFLDGHLVSISVSFTYGREYYAAVQAALQSKYGAATKSIHDGGGGGSLSDPALVWETEADMVQLQPHVCTLESTPNAFFYTQDLAVAMSGDYCVKGQSLSYGFSRVLYIDKALAGSMPQRIKDADLEKQHKANGDL